MPRVSVVAVISAFNEGDIIAPLIEHLVENGVGVYLIDNQSTDDTLEQARRWLGRGLIGVESFPSPGSADREPGFTPDPTAILDRKKELFRELDAGWFIAHDADEFLEAPWPGVTLAEAIDWVDRLGYDTVSFRRFEFRPLPASFSRGENPKERILHYDAKRVFEDPQTKCWKNAGEAIVPEADGAHDVLLPPRKVFPIRFLLRHYPIRGRERMEAPGIEDAALELFSPDRIRLGLLLENDARVGSRTIRSEFDSARSRLAAVEQELIDVRDDLERSLREVREARNGEAVARTYIQSVERDLEAQRSLSRSLREAAVVTERTITHLHERIKGLEEAGVSMETRERELARFRQSRLWKFASLYWAALAHLGIGRARHRE